MCDVRCAITELNRALRDRAASLVTEVQQCLSGSLDVGDDVIVGYHVAEPHEAAGSDRHCDEKAGPRLHARASEGLRANFF
jgi:hypothetical protein